MSKDIPANFITSHETPVHQTPTGRNKTYCQRCGLNNHDTQHCRASECFRCHRFGHTSRYCKIQIPQWSQPTVTCFSCDMFGHTNRQCRNVQWYPPQGKSSHFIKILKNADTSMVVIGAVNGKSGHIFIEVKLGGRNGKDQIALFDTSNFHNRR